MQTINVLWTGGLDSTYVVLRLSFLPNIVINPIYVIDPPRKSTRKELAAIRAITKDIRANKQTKAILNDVIIIQKRDISEDSMITMACKRLYEKYELGSQYDWLARYAKQTGRYLTLGLECTERSKVANVFDAEAVLYKHQEGQYETMRVDESQSSQDVNAVFKLFEIPTFIYKHTKIEEAEGFKQFGYEETMLKTWFCHRPVLGLTCGHCNPCKDALNEGMAYRVSKLGYILGGVEIGLKIA